MFDWQTEEEAAWEEVSAWSEGSAGPKRTPKWWWLALPLMVVATLLVVYRQAQKQTENALETVKQDVVSSQMLLHDAIDNQDEDLLRVLLSGRDMGWVFGIQQLMESGDFWDYGPFSLALVPDSYQLVDVALSPQLDFAEVSFTQMYTASPLGKEPKMVTLEQSAIFRRGATRWLYAPHEEAFWGEWETRRIEEVTLVYAARDAEFVNQLARELDLWLPRFCETLPDFPCDPWQKSIRFAPDLHTKLRLTETPAALYTNQIQLELPAPSLLGLPQDETSRNVLIDAYKSLIGRAYIADALGYRCCDHVLAFDALSTYQLAQLGLFEWPITIADHYKAWEADEANFSNLPLMWQEETILPIESAEQENLLLRIDFLIHTSNARSVVAMQRMLNQTTILTSTQWLNQLFANEDMQFFRGPNFSLEMLRELWRNYTYLYYEAGTTFGETAPSQALLLTCLPTSGNAINTAVYQHTALKSQWTVTAEERGYGLLFPFADDSQILFETLPFAGDTLTNTLEIWTPNQERRKVPLLDNTYNLSLGQISLDGRFVTTYSFAVNPNNTGPQAQFFDLNTCTESGCRQFNLPGTPYWSSNGRYALIQSFNDFDFLGQLSDRGVFLVPSPTNYQIFLSDVANITNQTTFIEIERGYSPFWLDNERFGFVKQREGSTISELYTATVTAPEPRLLLTSTALQNAVPSDQSSTAWHIGYAMALPSQPEKLIVVANDDRNLGHLFFFNQETNGVRYGTRLDITYSHQLVVSPNGRYIAASFLPNPDNPVVRDLKVIDLQTGSERLFPLGQNFAFPARMFDWSLDAEWLAIKAEINAVQVLHLPSGNRTVLQHPNVPCTAVSWITPFSE